MESFFQTVEPLVSLSSASRLALTGVAERLALPRQYQLIRQDTVGDRVYFIETGLARTYYYKDGKDVTDWLSAEGDFVGSMVSFLSQQPDRRGVELLEPSVLWAFPFVALENLYAQHHDIERLGRLLISHGLIQLQQRFDALHFSTAAERYESLMQNNPGLIQRVPLGMIASYLGMTQETLSRIRAHR